MLNARQALRERGNEAFKKGDYEASLGLYTEALIPELSGSEPLSVDERAALLNNRSAAYLKLGLIDAAISDAHQATQARPKAWRGWQRLGNALAVAGRIAEARSALQKAQKCVREDIDAGESAERRAAVAEELARQLAALRVDPSASANARGDPGEDKDVSIEGFSARMNQAASAILAGDGDRLRSVIAAGPIAELRAAGAGGATLIRVAASFGGRDAMASLLAAGLGDLLEKPGNNDLHHAANKKNSGAVAAILDHLRGVGGNTLRRALAARDGPSGLTPALSAAACGSEQCLELLLDADASALEARLLRPEGRSALHLAAEAGSEACVRLLLSRGAKPDDRDAKQHTALYCCAQASSAMAAANLGGRGEGGGTLISQQAGCNSPVVGATCGHALVARALLGAGADPLAKDWREETPLSVGFAHRSVLRVLAAFLRDHPPRSSEGPALLGRALVAAVAHGEAGCVYELLQGGLDANFDKGAPLRGACVSNLPAVASVLASGGADPFLNDSGRFERTPVWHALQATDAALLRAILPPSLEPRRTPSPPPLLLRAVTIGGRAERITALLDAGFRADERDPAGFNAYHEAARDARLLPALRALLAHPAASRDPAALLAALSDRANPEGATPLELAEQSGAAESAALLREAAARASRAGQPPPPPADVPEDPDADSAEDEAGAREAAEEAAARLAALPSWPSNWAGISATALRQMVYERCLQWLADPSERKRAPAGPAGGPNWSRDEEARLHQHADAAGLMLASHGRLSEAAVDAGAVELLAALVQDPRLQRPRPDVLTSVVRGLSRAAEVRAAVRGRLLRLPPAALAAIARAACFQPPPGSGRVQLAIELALPVSATMLLDHLLNRRPAQARATLAPLLGEPELCRALVAAAVRLLSVEASPRIDGSAIPAEMQILGMHNIGLLLLQHVVFCQLDQARYAIPADGPLVSALCAAVDDSRPRRLFIGSVGRLAADREHMTEGARHGAALALAVLAAHRPRDVILAGGLRELVAALRAVRGREGSESSLQRHLAVALERLAAAGPPASLWLLRSGALSVAGPLLLAKHAAFGIAAAAQLCAAVLAAARHSPSACSEALRQVGGAEHAATALSAALGIGALSDREASALDLALGVPGPRAAGLDAVAALAAHWTLADDQFAGLFCSRVVPQFFQALVDGWGRLSPAGALASLLAVSPARVSLRRSRRRQAMADRRPAAVRALFPSDAARAAVERRMPAGPCLQAWQRCMRPDAPSPPEPLPLAAAFDAEGDGWRRDALAAAWEPSARVCGGCGALVPDATKGACGGCRRAHFCGQPCLAAAWRAHKPECGHRSGGGAAGPK